jgi:MFS family permease
MADAQEVSSARGTRLKSLAAVAVVSVVFIIYWWDRTGFSVELIEIRKAFGFSTPTGGLLSSVFVLGVAIISIPAGVIVLRIGVGWGIIVGTIVFSLATLYTAFAPGFAEMFVARVITGVGEGLFNVAVYTYLGSITFRYRGASVGYTGILIGIGGFTGPIMVAGTLSGSGHWQGAFLVLAGAGLLGAILLLFTRVWLLRSVSDWGGTLPTRETSAPSWEMFREVLKPWFVPIAFAVLVGGFMTYANIAAYESFLRTVHHFSLNRASLIVGLSGIGTFVGAIPFGYWGDRTGRRFALIWSTALAGVLTTSQYWAPGQAVVLGTLTIISGAVNINLYNQAFAAVQDYVAPHARSAAVGAVSVFFFLGGAFAGYLFLALEGSLHSYAGATVAVFTIPAVLTAVIVAVMMPRQSPAAQRIQHKQMEAV